MSLSPSAAKFASGLAPERTEKFAIRRRLLVLALFPLVYCSRAALAAGATKSGSTKDAATAKAGPGREPIIGRDISRLPPAVADMRGAILAAVEAGDIAELRGAIELNELKPDFGAPFGDDPIAFLKAQSGDGEGREMLAILGRLLDSGWAALPGGRDIENGRIYVWPYFAEVALDKLTAAEEVALYRLVTPAEAKAMRAAKRWTWWRLSIGADGVWHSFGRMP